MRKRERIINNAIKHVATNYKDKLNRKDELIDLMAEQLAGLTIWNNEKEEPLILTDKEAVKLFFEEKLEDKKTKEERAINNLGEIIELCRDELDENNKNVNATLDFEDLKSLQIVLRAIKNKNKLINIICEYLSKGNQIAGAKEQIKEFFENELEVE